VELKNDILRVLVILYLLIYIYSPHTTFTPQLTKQMMTANNNNSSSSSYSSNTTSLLLFSLTAWRKQCQWYLKYYKHQQC